MQQPSQPTGDGVIAIIRCDDRYLLIQRAHGILAGGKWCFVGGGLEPPESQEQALVREVREEVGLIVEPVARVWEGVSPNGQWRLHGWTTTLMSTDITANPAEVAAHEWVTAPQLRDWPELLPSVLDVVRACSSSDDGCGDRL